MADESFFARLKKDAFFFNASRGEAADTKALKKALRGGRLSGTALDVWENEPDIDRELLEMCHFGTMHIAGYSADGKANGTAASVRAVAAALGITELAGWSPEKMPEPPQQKEFPFTSVKEALLHTYDPREDGARLKAAPEQFEELRGSYPVRREFKAFTVTEVPAEKQKCLERFGFRTAVRQSGEEKS